MPIVTSTIAEDHAQIDGRRAIREQHVDDAGKVFDVSYLAEARDDVAKRLAPRAAQIDAAEAARKAAEAEAARVQQAQTKVDSYLDSKAEVVIKTETRMTDEEYAAWKAARQGVR